MSQAMTETEILDAADRYMADKRPVVIARRARPLGELERGHERYVVASGGMYLEVSRPWVTARVQVSTAHTELPFGNVEERTTMRCGPVPQHLVQAFIDQARAALPNEASAWITWNEKAAPDSAWSLHPLQALDASRNHITVERPLLGEGVHRVIDIHSHGTFAAFFSSQDDADDAQASEVVVAMVVGNVDAETPSAAARLCVMGHFRAIPLQFGAASTAQQGGMQ